MSYVDLVETMLVKKDDTKQPPTGGGGPRAKKAKMEPCQDDSMDTTPIPEDSPSSKTMILRPLCNSPTPSNYQSEPMS